MTDSLKTAIGAIQKRISEAAMRCGRDPYTVKLVAVGKKKPAVALKEAVEAGATILGESYIQEAMAKIDTLCDLQVAWHFIGHLQRNKAKFAVQYFDLIHSVDNVKLAAEIDKQAQKIEKVQPILIQVNLGRESSKAGVDTERVLDLIRHVACLPAVQIQGLMAIPPFYEDPEAVRPYFKALKDLRLRIETLKLKHVSMAELSMGMTSDFEIAIEEGATLVRIGTAIFGKRG